jgi:hypothetical protein
MGKPQTVKTIGTLLDMFLDRGKIAEAAEHAQLHHAWQEIVLDAFLGRAGRRKGGASQAAETDFADDAETQARINAEKLIWHSRVRELDRGRLVIEVDHPGWGQLLQFRQRALLAAVQRRFPSLQVMTLAVILQKGASRG